MSKHLVWSWTWFNVNKNSDKTGPYAGVPNDGNDARYYELYHPPHPATMRKYGINPPDS